MHSAPMLRLSLLCAFGRLALANSFGPNWGSGPVHQYKSNKDGTMVPDPNAAQNNFITYGEATLIMPNVPNPIVGNTVLWLGMGTYHLPYGNLIQGITNNYPSSHDPSDECGDLGNRWCVAAFMLQHDQNPTGKKVIAVPGDRVTSVYRWTEGQNYEISMAINGQIVSSITVEAGYANGFGFANECTTKPCGTVEAHDWVDIKLVLAKADPKYDLTHGPKGYNDAGVKGGISTADGGKTWTSQRIHIPAHTFKDY